MTLNEPTKVFTFEQKSFLTKLLVLNITMSQSAPEVDLIGLTHALLKNIKLDGKGLPQPRKDQYDCFLSLSVTQEEAK